jgi:SAM-dependent methyltransferase
MAESMSPREYWNHNTQFHPELVRAAARLGGDVLDVGCGEGLLVERLAAVSRSVTGIDPDAGAVARARERGIPGADLRVAGLDDFDPEGRWFDLVTVVATLHHLPLEPALTRLRALVRPGGELRVVGLARNVSPADMLWSAVTLMPTVLGDRRHGGVVDPDVGLAEPTESLADVRSAARRVLPAARIRRRLYWRYTLTWTAPTA